MEYYSAIKNNKIMPFAALWMDLEIVRLSEVSLTEKTNILWHCLYVEPLKKKSWYKWTYFQNRNWVTDVENKLMATEGEKARYNGRLWSTYTYYYAWNR